MSELNSILSELFKNNKNNYIDFVEFSKDNFKKSCLILCFKKELHGRFFFINSLNFKNLYFLDSNYNLDNIDVVVSLGYGPAERNISILKKCIDKKIFFLEAAFLRSILMDKSSSVYDQAMCFFIDDLGYHYDPTNHSRIEMMLNDSLLKLDARQIKRAKNIIHLLTSTRLTKYNNQPEYSLNIGNPDKSKVLVVEQARNDYAILKSKGTHESFNSMLERAIIDNPNSDIIVKTHPDTLDGKRGGLKKSYYGKIATNCKRVFLLTEKINPFCLLELVDKVYVFSSMLGFESLLLKKETHVFGLPCYAGWGLTIDYQKNNNRTNTRSIEELVYIIYVLYTKYKNKNGEWAEVENMIEFLTELKKQYFLTTK